MLDKCLICGVSTDDIRHVSLYKGAGNVGEREIIYAWIGRTDATIINDLSRQYIRYIYMYVHIYMYVYIYIYTCLEICRWRSGDDATTIDGPVFESVWMK